VKNCLQIIQLVVPLQRECQLANWPVHKAECKAMRAMREQTRRDFKAVVGRRTLNSTDPPSPRLIG
jgi:hypothetical protein